MCDRGTIDKFKHIFDEYRNMPDGVGSRRTLVSMLIKLLLSILIKLLVSAMKKVMEE